LNPPVVQLDHLVVAARTLGEGATWCRETLGIEPGPGGRHALMGTHNRVVSIASAAFPCAYLEIIAIDPDAPPPGRARWFGLDTLDLRAGPRLIHWVARTTALEATLAALRAAGHDAGRVLEASRETPQGVLQWRIVVRDDGVLTAGGALPTLIAWGDRHPTASMRASGVALHSIALCGLSDEVVRALALPLEWLGNGAALPALTATLETRFGRVSLRTSDLRGAMQA
jgi:hypothetical protein